MTPDPFSPAEAEDARPVVRIAGFGLAQKFQRMTEIVLKHARHNPYRFVMAPARGPGDFEIALVDMTAKGAPQVAATLERLPGARPIVTLGRRRDGDRPHDDLYTGDYLMHLVKVLNDAVQKMGRWPGQVAQAFGAFGAHDSVPSFPRVPEPTRVLVVDDSPAVQRQLSLALQQLGLATDCVGSADEALEALTLRRYELVFTDVMMPVTNGFSLTKSIKRDRALKKIPVIMLTSRSSPLDLARGALAGCNSYLVKPVAIHALRTTVQRHLKRNQQRDAMATPVAVMQ